MCNTLNVKFHEDMKNIYFSAKKDLNYNATRFIQLVADKGGVQAAKQLVMKSSGTDGFATLLETGRLDLSVEAYVIKEEYKELFSKEEIEVCRVRLQDAGYFNQEEVR